MEEARTITMDPARPTIPSGEAGSRQRSGQAFRPIQDVRRAATTAEDAVTELERYKVSLRRYCPVQKGLGGLPWPGQWECGRCGELTPGRLLHQPADDRIALEHDCPRCGTWREPHADLLFTAPRVSAHPRQPRETYTGAPIRPIPRALPRTVETLCPECACLILGRSYEKRRRGVDGEDLPGARLLPRQGQLRRTALPPVRGALLRGRAGGRSAAGRRRGRPAPPTAACAPST